MKKSSRIALVTLLVLSSSTVALAVGALSSGLTISSLYINSPGTVVRVNIGSGTIANPDSGNGGSCTGATFRTDWLVFEPDYTTTAKAEASKQIVSALTAAYLSGKQITVYSQGCMADPWGGGKVAKIYDINY